MLSMYKANKGGVVVVVVYGVLKLKYSLFSLKHNKRLKEKCSFNNNLALTLLTAGYIRSFRN